jgi:predicted dehydrogenase
LAASATGIAGYHSDWRELIARRDVDAVVIATPNHLHHEIALAAIAEGKHVLCEKPLTLHVAGAREMLEAAETAGVVHMTAFTYQFAPAIRYLKHLVDAGQLGRIRTIRAAYLMALSGHLLGWRSLKEYAGSGVLADIGSHLVHLAQYVAGEIASLTASEQQFRDDPTSDTEDWVGFLARFATGACATFEVARICPGRGAAITEDMFIEVYGTDGSAVFSLQQPWSLMVSLGQAAREPARPLERLEVPADFLRIPNSPRDPSQDDPRWGYRYDQAFQFAESIRQGQSRVPSFLDGARCQAVLDAALQSARSTHWVEVIPP